MIRLIEALGHGTASHGGPVHLVGNSMGGAVSVRVAARRPDLVRTLTLVSPALPDLKVRRSVAHFPLLALPFVGERLVRQWALRYPVENRVAGVFETCFSDPSRLHPDRFAAEVEALRRRDGLSYEAASLVGAARTLVGETLRPAPLSLWRAAARVTAPCLVLFGQDDRLVHPRLAARAARVFRDARVRVLPETGHLAQMERPGLVAALFREMVDEDPWSRTQGIQAVATRLMLDDVTTNLTGVCTVSLTTGSLPPLVEPAADLSVDEVKRYSRHLIIPDVGMAGQKRLKNAKVLVVGAGGLGSPALLYLAAAGVGTLGIVDFDTVDESNLQRQIIHGVSDVGKSKAESAKESIEEVNPYVKVILHKDAARLRTT